MYGFINMSIKKSFIQKFFLAKRAILFFPTEIREEISAEGNTSYAFAWIWQASFFDNNGN